MLADPDLSKFKSEGDLNISPRRAAWVREHIDAETRRWLDLDAQYFLHQSLSTPCLDVLAHCGGAGDDRVHRRRKLS